MTKYITTKITTNQSETIKTDFIDFKIIADDGWPMHVIFQVGGQRLRAPLRLINKSDEDLLNFFNEIAGIEVVEFLDSGRKRVTIILK